MRNLNDLYRVGNESKLKAYRESLKKTILRKNSKEAKHFLACVKRGMYKVIEKNVFDGDGPSSSTITELTYEHFLYEFNKKDGWNGLTGKNVNQLRLTNGVYSFHCIYSRTSYEVILTPKGRRINLIKAL